jgi:guanyl-specific ribonuclease Sa
VADVVRSARNSPVVLLNHQPASAVAENVVLAPETIRTTALPLNGLTGIVWRYGPYGYEDDGVVLVVPVALVYFVI